MSCFQHQLTVIVNGLENSQTFGLRVTAGTHTSNGRAMGQSSSKKVADLKSRATLHPIVERLEAGLAVYSQSFTGDLWLVYKNTHVVASCFGTSLLIRCSACVSMWAVLHVCEYEGCHSMCQYVVFIQIPAGSLRQSQITRADLGRTNSLPPRSLLYIQ